ncbi:MAG: hypothetical protein ACJAYS_000569 [Lentimonas sp.]|jgi:hypothetical protein
MNEIKYFKSWVIFFLVSGIGGLCAGFLAGFAGGVLISLFNPDDPEGAIQQYASLFQILGFLVALPVSFICYKWTVSKYILSQVDNP